MAPKKVVRPKGPRILEIAHPSTLRKRARRANRRGFVKPPRESELSPGLRKRLGSIEACFSEGTPAKVRGLVFSLSEMASQGDAAALAENLEAVAGQAFRAAEKKTDKSVRSAYARAMIDVYDVCLSLYSKARVKGKMNRVLDGIERVNSTFKPGL